MLNIVKISQFYEMSCGTTLEDMAQNWIAVYRTGWEKREKKNAGIHNIGKS